MTNITLQSTVSPIIPTWCPGCGNFGILGAMRQAFTQLELPEENLVVFYGVGCSGNMADFNNVYGFHALHGRAIPNAIGAKLSNHKLKIIVVAGDGDTYGEGMNHFLSAARGNHDITILVHNNQTYSLTTGQSSPTTPKGRKTKSTPAPEGIIEQPVNPLALALDADAGFVARGYAGDMAHLIGLIKEAMNYEGFSVVDVLQPCPTFNKINSYQWYQERIYKLGEDYVVNSKQQAWDKSQEIEKLPVGVFYKNDQLVPYHQQLHQLKEKTLLEQRPEKVSIAPSLKEFV